MVNIIFFGSFQHYSALILQSLIDRSLNHEIEVTGVITTPPTPMGRKKILTKNPTHLLAEKHNIPVFTPTSLTTDAESCRSVFLTTQGSEGSRVESKIYDERRGVIKPDFFITAGYGKILPKEWLEYPKIGCLNLHFSLLPRYRGANPAEWAIMCGETETGITLMEMNEGLDKGAIMQQASIEIIGDACPEQSRRDTRETLYEKLYSLGASLLPSWLLDAENLAFQRADMSSARADDASTAKASFESTTEQPNLSPTPYAALLKRDDGFIPWTTIQKYLQKKPLTFTDFPSKHLQTALKNAEKNLIFQRAAGPRLRESSTAKMQIFEEFLHRLPRALSGFPSLWTMVKTTRGEKRMKILSFTPFLVHLEGGQPTSFNQIKNTLQ